MDIENPAESHQETETATQSVQTLVASAKQSVLIVSECLIPAAYSENTVIEKLSALLRKSRYTYAQIIVTAPKGLSITHPLVKLSHRLSSTLQIKTLRPTPAPLPPPFILADHNQLLTWTDEKQNKGVYRDDTQVAVKQYREQFLQLWETSGEDIPEIAQFVL